MPIELLGVDAFTDQPFRGNPAAICFLDHERDDRWMQSLAVEMNLSETAFVLAREDAYDLRWFTPATEVELCGHATLASAHALWETGRHPADAPVRFETRWKGALVASKAGDGIKLDFPSTPSVACDTPDGLTDALGVEINATLVNDLHHVVHVESEHDVRALAPDFGALNAVDVEAVAVTAPADNPEFDFVSRYFAPKYGVDEDPVTGSAHTSLGPYWGERLRKRELTAQQVSARGGVVRVVLRDERVDLIGNAVTVWRGELSS